MIRMRPPSLNVLRQSLDFDPETGLFYHKHKHPKRRRGDIAGCASKDGYWQIGIERRIYFAHRLAWYYVSGMWPDQLDHKNGIKTDNRIANLRPATSSQNQANKAGWPLHKRKHKLPHGVYPCSNNLTRYFAMIGVNYRQRNLGYFTTIKGAQRAYQRAAHHYFGEFVWHDECRIQNTESKNDPANQ